MLTLDQIYHAAYVLKPVIRKTDLIAAPDLNHDSEISLKTENLQVTGSFKVRGAYYKISLLTKEEQAKGIIACSAGNHAQGVALAAQRSGIESLICMPDGAPISKVEATKSYGAQVKLVKGAYDDAYEEACRLQKEKEMCIRDSRFGHQQSGYFPYHHCGAGGRAGDLADHPSDGETD